VPRVPGVGAPLLFAVPFFLYGGTLFIPGVTYLPGLVLSSSGCGYALRVGGSGAPSIAARSFLGAVNQMTREQEVMKKTMLSIGVLGLVALLFIKS